MRQTVKETNESEGNGKRGEKYFCAPQIWAQDILLWLSRHIKSVRVLGEKKELLPVLPSFLLHLNPTKAATPSLQASFIVCSSNVISCCSAAVQRHCNVSCEMSFTTNKWSCDRGCDFGSFVFFWSGGAAAGLITESRLHSLGHCS